MLRHHFSFMDTRDIFSGHPKQRGIAQILMNIYDNAGSTCQSFIHISSSML